MFENGLPEDLKQKFKESIPDTEKLRELVKYAADRTDEIVEEGTNSLTPIFMVLAVQLNVDTMDIEKSHQIFAINGNFNDDIAKWNIMRSLAAKLYVEHMVPVGAVLVAEAWSAQHNEKDTTPFLRPYDAPNRQEVAIIFGQSLNPDITSHGRRVMAARPEGGSEPIVWAGEWEMDDKAESGLMARFFGSYAKFAHGMDDAEQWADYQNYHDVGATR